MPRAFGQKELVMMLDTRVDESKRIGELFDEMVTKEQSNWADRDRELLRFQVQRDLLAEHISSGFHESVDKVPQRRQCHV